MSSVWFKIFQHTGNGKEVLWGIGKNPLEKVLESVQYIVDSAHTTDGFYVAVNGVSYSFEDFCKLCNIKKRSFEERMNNIKHWNVSRLEEIVG